MFASRGVSAASLSPYSDPANVRAYLSGSETNSTLSGRGCPYSLERSRKLIRKRLGTTPILSDLMLRSVAS